METDVPCSYKRCKSSNPGKRSGNAERILSNSKLSEIFKRRDELNLQSKLSNLTNKKMNGSAELQILDAFTNENISSKFGITSGTQNFDLDENGNGALTWKLKVPIMFHPLF
jgi:hypothetical protein